MSLPQGFLTALVMVVAAVGALPAAEGGAGPGAARLVVSFDAMPSGLQAHGRYLDAEVLSVDEASGFAVVAAPDEGAFRGKAAEHREVRGVERDVALASSRTPNDPEFAVSQYGPQLIGAPTAWDASSLRGSGITVCIVDTGLRLTHADLVGQYAGGIDLVNGDADPSDDNGHGTHVAGIAAAGIGNGFGIAGVSNAQLKVAKVLDASGNGYLSTVAAGIRWCADNGAQVISMSLGAPAPLSAAQDAVSYAWSKGALLVAASGNGACADCVLWPAQYDNVIAVGCVDPSRVTCPFESQGPQIDLAAPGYGIQSTGWTSDTALIRASGTSMSAPHVAGAAALVWAAHADYTNAQVRQALEASAQDVGAAGRDNASGFGLVRADLAMAASVAAPAPAPAPSPAPAPAPDTHGVSVSPASQAKTIAAKATTVYTVQVTNTGSAADAFWVSKAVNRAGWTTSLDATQLTLQPGETAVLHLTVTAPAKSAPMTVTLTVSSLADAMASGTATAKTAIGK